MLRLDLANAPRWLDLLPGVRYWTGKVSAMPRATRCP